MAYHGNSNNNNITYIAQIRKRSRKCAAMCQRQTEMFSVSFWRWSAICRLLQIVWQVTMNSETAVSITCPRSWNDELASVGRSQVTATYSTLSGMAARDRWDTCTQWLLSWIQSAAERVASVDVSLMYCVIHDMVLCSMALDGGNVLG